MITLRVERMELQARNSVKKRSEQLTANYRKLNLGMLLGKFFEDGSCHCYIPHRGKTDNQYTWLLWHFLFGLVKYRV